MGLNSELATLFTEIDANLSHLESISIGLSPAQFNWQPAPGRWSIGQCLAHLNLSNAIGLQSIEPAIEEGRKKQILGEGPFEYGFIATKFLRSQEVNSGSKFTAPKVFRPPEQIPLETLRSYQAMCERQRTAVIAANGLHLRKIKCQMLGLPALVRRILRVPLGAYLAIMVTHDRRHLYQAEAVRSAPGFPSS